MGRRPRNRSRMRCASVKLPDESGRREGGSGHDGRERGGGASRWKLRRSPRLSGYRDELPLPGSSSRVLATRAAALYMQTPPPVLVRSSLRRRLSLGASVGTQAGASGQSMTDATVIPRRSPRLHCATAGNSTESFDVDRAGVPRGDVAITPEFSPLVRTPSLWSPGDACPAQPTTLAESCPTTARDISLRRSQRLRRASSSLDSENHSQIRGRCPASPSDPSVADGLEHAALQSLLHSPHLSEPERARQRRLFLLSPGQKAAFAQLCAETAVRYPAQGRRTPLVRGRVTCVQQRRAAKRAREEADYPRRRNATATVQAPAVRPSSASRVTPLPAASSGIKHRVLFGWTIAEDAVLRRVMADCAPQAGCVGKVSWVEVAEMVRANGVMRTRKQCRDRWINHLQEGLRTGPYTPAEDWIVLREQRRIGNRVSIELPCRPCVFQLQLTLAFYCVAQWAVIAKRLPGRSEQNVKNNWHTRLNKVARCFALTGKLPGAIEAEARKSK